MITHFIFDVQEQEKSHWVPNQGCTMDDPSFQYFGYLKIPLCQSVRILIVIKKNYLYLFLLFFFNFSNEFYQTNGLVQEMFRIDHPALLKCHCYHVSGNDEEESNHLLVLLPLTIFVRYGLSWMIHTVDCSFILGLHA